MQRNRVVFVVRYPGIAENGNQRAETVRVHAPFMALLGAAESLFQRPDTMFYSNVGDCPTFAIKHIKLSERVQFGNQLRR